MLLLVWIPTPQMHSATSFSWSFQASGTDLRPLSSPGDTHILRTSIAQKRGGRGHATQLPEPSENVDILLQPEV